jgi:hypothetical protein
LPGGAMASVRPHAAKATRTDAENNAFMVVCMSGLL